MATIVFYEKPGCTGNARQKKLLRAAGHDLIVRDMLSESWTPAKLRPFFGARPVTEWFNRNAPAVKSGDLDPARFGESDALALLCADPILIRRPLLQIGDLFSAGFETDTVAMLLGPVGRHATEACPRAEAPCPARDHG